MRLLFSLFILAPGIGVVVAGVSIAFIDCSLLLYRHATTTHPAWVLCLPVAAGIICAQLGKRLPDNLFLGLADMVLLSQRDIRPKLRHHLLSSALSFISLAGGLSVGLYGPIAHLGGSIGSVLHSYLPPKITAACGIAAAISAAFNAPITGLIFAHELILRHYSVRTLTPVTISAVVGYLISADVFERPLFLDIADMQVLPPTSVLLFIALGLLFGVLAFCYMRGLFFVARYAGRFANDYKLPLAGILTGGIILLLPDLGMGDRNLLTAALTGIPIGLAAVLLLGKITATVLCIGSGFPGGIISPTLAIGALAGIIAAHTVAALPADIFAVPASAVVLCAMMALVAPVIGAPLTAILFVLELSGNYPMTIVAAVSITIAVQTTAKLGMKNFYETQLARRGYDLQQRQDEWALQRTTMRHLARPAAVALTPDATAQQAITAATAAAVSDIFVIADNSSRHLLAHLRLPDLLAHPPATALANIRPAAPTVVLDADDSVAVATQKLESFVGSTAPVTERGTLIGTVSEGQLLIFHRQQTRQYREEETAV